MNRKTAETRNFEALSGRYARLIKSVVGRVAGQYTPLVGEDVEQRVLIALWKITESEQKIHHPSSYLYRAAVRETARLVRRELRKKEQLNDLAGRKGDRVRNPEELAISRELGAEIAGVLQELSADRRRAVRAHLAGFDVREIMEMFEWPYQKARNLIARGMAGLRQGLRERGYDG